MEKFWKAAVGVGGIASVGAFVFWSLYKDWLKLPVFSQMTSDQTFLLMIIFLALTFLSLTAMLVVYAWTKHMESKSTASRELRSKVELVSGTLDRHNQRYEETIEDGRSTISPRDGGNKT